MAIIKPFKGVRPPQQYVEDVESRPYDVLDSEEARIEAGITRRVFIISSNRKLILSQELPNTTHVFMKVPKRILNFSRRMDGWFRIPRNIIIYTPRQ